MVDKFWNFFRGSATAKARAPSDAPSRADRPPGAAALALEAERGPCDVRSRASRAPRRAELGVCGAAAGCCVHIRHSRLC